MDENIIKETANNRLYTYGDYLEWNDEERCELIDGRVYMMTPAPYRQHQKVLTELFRQIANYLVGKECEVYVAPFDVRLPEKNEKDENIKTVVQPDIVVICDKNKLDKRGSRGAPDLIIEILSPSSAAKDRKIKRNLYERHGVKEYWLVNYNEKTVEIYLINEINQYDKPTVYTEEDNDSVTLFEDLNISLSSVFKD